MPISVSLSYQIHQKNLKKRLPVTTLWKEFPHKFYHYQDCLYPVIHHHQTVQQQIQIITNQIIKLHRPVALGKKQKFREIRIRKIASKYVTQSSTYFKTSDLKKKIHFL